MLNTIRIWHFVSAMMILPLGLIAKPIQLYSEHIPPSQIVNDKGIIVAGTSYVVVLELLKRAQIDAVHTPLPWARAFKLTQKEPNTLIYSLARTPLREDLFEWVGKIQVLQFYFYGIQLNHETDSINATDLQKLSVVVVRDSVEAEILQGAGFELGKNLYLADSYVTAYKMALKGRVDVLYANTFSTDGITKVLGLTDQALKPIYTLNQSMALYLAANKNSSPDLINKLRNEFTVMEEEGVIKQLIEDELLRLFQKLPSN